MVNRSWLSWPGSRWLELARSDRPNGLRAQHLHGSELRIYWSDAILSRLRPVRPTRLARGEFGQEKLDCIVRARCPRCEEIRNLAPTESPLATQVTRQGATDATGQATAGAGHACGGTL